MNHRVSEWPGWREAESGGNALDYVSLHPGYSLKRVTKKVGLMSLERYFVFNTIDRIKENYASGWYDAHGKPSTLFVKK